MKCKGFEIREMRNGAYEIKVDGYTQICKSFNEAGEFVWNMADNHEISHAVCTKMCKVFGKKFC